MPTQLQWSNRAHTALSPTNGSFNQGDARWCGYVDVAVHIAGNPGKFQPVDQAKAKNILMAEGKLKLARLIEAKASPRITYGDHT